MPPRFYSSPYKNAIVSPAKREGWWSELPVSSAAPSDSADLIRASSEYWIAQGASSGSLVVHSYEHAGKLGGKAPTLQTGCRIVQSFDVSPFDDYLAVGGDNGQINVFDLPALSSFESNSSQSPAPVLSLSQSSAKPVDTISFHPTTASLLLASSAQALAVYDVSSRSASPVFEIDAPAQSWSAQWSQDGKLVSATGKDGRLRLWDVRIDSSKVAAEILAHPGVKTSRHVHLSHASSPQILSTGFSRTRDREYSLFDGRMLGNAIKTQRLDTSTGVLVPVVDRERGIVYLAGRGDMSLRWVEVGGPSIFTEGSTPFPAQVAGAALVPPHHLDLMTAEINRLVVVTNDQSVVPVSVQVPRRQYVDFHADLYPEVSKRAPAQSAADWIGGKDAPVETYKPDPLRPFTSSKRSETVKGFASRAGTDQATAVSTEPTPQGPKSEQGQTPTVAESASEASDPSLPRQEPSRQDCSATPTRAVSALSIKDEAQPSPPPPASTSPSEPPAKFSGASPAKASGASPLTPSEPVSKPPNGSRSSEAEPFNPGWSRKFLAGKTPIKPDYFDVKDLSVTMSADVELLKANSNHFFYPLSGPGGRLAVHPLSSKGRLPVHVPTLVSGSTVVNFELDPFDPTRVFVACDDDAIRVFRVPAEGLDKDLEEPEKVLKDASMVKISELRHHPAARDVLLSVSDDRGHPKARIWNTETGDLVASADLPAGGVSSAAWSPDGSQIVVSTKKKQIVVLDPRNPSTAVSCPSHESIRPAIVAWASPNHIVSTGFTLSSSRELLLYNIDGGSLEQVGRQILDVSPALLIPFVDLDTRILLCYSRGERVCFAYEVDLDATTSTPFSKLPSFAHPTLQSGFAWFPKARNDVRAVEIVKCLRLTPATVEAVSFTVPRMKTEYFQDDIFVPTRNREKPSMTAREWLDGKNTPLDIVDLQPAGTKPLSEAPAPQKTVSTRSKIKNDGLTDSQREKQYMDRLFESAKDEQQGDEEDDEPQIGRSRVGAPSDDDDW
ncbi:hypothetical protein JCM10212_006354 [Sporobolomyces blumeae]